MRTRYNQLINTAENAGLKIIADEHCCKLLAWLYAYGGHNEAVISNVKLKEDIRIAQNRLNIIGGEMPNKELFPKLRTYLLQVEPHMLFANKAFEHPSWVSEICNYYGIVKP